MIPVIHCTTALARALGAKPGWPMNPPQHGGLYITARDKGRAHWFWPQEKRR